VNCLDLPFTVLKFKLGRLTNDEIKRAFLKGIMQGCTRAEVEGFTADFVSGRFARMIKRKAIARIDLHRRQGHLLVLATASLDFYADAIGRSLGFDHVVATRAAWDSDKIAGSLDGDNLRGEAKLTAVKRVLTRLNGDISLIVAYSDDHSDLPILRFADRGIAIDPTPKLVAAASIYGLETEVWSEEPDPRRRS